MKRRQFMGLLGGAFAWPLAARPGPSVARSGTAPRIGILVLGDPDPTPFTKGIRDGLRDLGYVEGQNILFEFRSAGGNAGRLSSLAKELVALKVDVITAFQTPAATAARQATTEIPIIIFSGDPVGTGLVSSLARPGGNVTGVSGAVTELGAKNLELIRDVWPTARLVGFLGNAADPFRQIFLDHLQTAARPLSVEIKSFVLRGPAEFEAAFIEMTRSGTNAVISQSSLPLGAIAELAVKHRIPSFSPNPEFPHLGGLMSYSADYDVLYRDCAAFVDKVLKGRKPADLPLQLPTKFWLTINMKTAKTLDLALPPALLARADKVIE
jgi:ABC-type uncharacterized transport system substrate-binding protein